MRGKFFYEDVVRESNRRKVRKNKRWGALPDEEKIRKWIKLSPKWRLIWLEEANRFLEKALSKKEREVLEKFRREII